MTQWHLLPSLRDKNTPFVKWTKEQVCGWLEDEGLGQYVSLTRQWVTSGQTLLAATPQDIEKVRCSGGTSCWGWPVHLCVPA